MPLRGHQIGLIIASCAVAGFAAVPTAHAVIQNGANAIDLLGQYEDPTGIAGSLTGRLKIRF